MRDQCLDDPAVDIHEVRKLLLEAIGKQEQPTAAGQRIEMGESDVEKFSSAAGDAIAFRAGIAHKDAKPTDLCGYTLLEMARKSLELAFAGNSPMQIMPNGMGAAPVNVTMNIQTPDARGFRQSQGQIAADMARSIERARRNL